MSTLQYVGRTPDADGILVPKSYADSTNTAQALTTTWVNNQVAAAAALLTNQSYVDLGDAALAHKSAVSAADLNYAATTLLGVASGVARLDSGGSLPLAVIPTGVPTDRIVTCYSMAPSVGFEAIGTPGYAWGTSGTPTTVTGSHTSVGGATTVVLAYVDTIPNGNITSAPTAAPSYGGTPMTMLGSPILHNISGTAYGYGAVFYLFNPPAGAKSVVTTLTAPGVASGGWFTTVQTVSYLHVSSLGTPVSNFDTTGSSTTGTLSSVPCPTNGLISVGFGESSGTGGSNFTGLNQTIRYNNTASAAGLYFMIGEAGATGASSYTFTATLNSGSGWAAFGVPLFPGGSGGQTGVLNFSGSTTVTGTTVQKLASITVADPGWPWRAIPMAFVAGDSSGATQPATRSLGTGSYGALTVLPAGGTQVYGLGICSGSFYTDLYSVLPYAAAGQTPTSVPPITGGLELDLCGQLWSGSTYTFYAANLVYFLFVVPAL